jgi:hypothetical protein
METEITNLARCSTLSAQIAAENVRYLSNRQKEDPCTAETVSRNTALPTETVAEDVRDTKSE